MRTEKKIDVLLRNALSPDQKPKEDLNRDILRQWKEIRMKSYRKRKMWITAAAACCMLAVSMTAYAAVKYLSAGQAAEINKSPEITAAFQGESAIEMQETQEAGDYRFTLLGITSGEAVYQSSLSAELPDNGASYAVLAIERLDGSPMPEPEDDYYRDHEFFVSPLIQGLTPWQYNIGSMNGGYRQNVVNGVLYRIIECDDIEKFADRRIYLCVSDTTFYDTQAYRYNEADGTITRNEGYSGINLLFDLPIDPSRADPAAAAEYLEALEVSWQPESQEDGTGGGVKEENYPTVEEVLQNAVLQEDSVAEVTQKNGEYVYSTENGLRISGSSLPQEYFPDGKTGWSDNIAIMEDEVKIYYVMFYLDENGVMTGNVFEKMK